MAGLPNEVLRFYKDHGYRFSDLYDPKRHGGCRLSKAQVTAGGVEYYEKIQAGEIAPRQIEMGWGVIECAKNARYEDFLKDNEIIRKHKPIIEGLQANTVKLERNKRNLWYTLWPLIAGFLYLLFEYIDKLGGIPI